MGIVTIDRRSRTQSAGRIEADAGLDDAKRDLDKIETAESVASALAANLVREYGDEVAGLIANAVNDQIGF